MEKGNFYWATVRAAVFSALTIFITSCIHGCMLKCQIDSHNCAVKWADRAKVLSANFETNTVVEKIKFNEGGSYYGLSNAKLLLYKEADMKFGVGGYDLEMAEYNPCPKHGGVPRIYYTIRRKERK